MAFKGILNKEVKFERGNFKPVKSLKEFKKEHKEFFIWLNNLVNKRGQS